METLNPVNTNVVEDRVADLVTAAAPAAIGEATVSGRMAPAAFRCRRQMDTERGAEAPGTACFELGPHQIVYASAPSAPHRAPRTYHRGLQATVKLLQNKQREVIWQLRSDVSP